MSDSSLAYSTDIPNNEPKFKLSQKHSDDRGKLHSSTTTTKYMQEDSIESTSYVHSFDLQLYVTL